MGQWEAAHSDKTSEAEAVLHVLFFWKNIEHENRPNNTGLWKGFIFSAEWIYHIGIMVDTNLIKQFRSWPVAADLRYVTLSVFVLSLSFLPGFERHF